MTTNPLRVEFPLVGFSLLLAILGCVEGVHWRHHGHLLSLARWWAIATKGNGVLALGIALAVAYVLGLLCVQLTFFFPTAHLIRRTRMARLGELRGLDRYLRVYEPGKEGDGLREEPPTLTSQQVQRVMPLAFSWPGATSRTEVERANASRFAETLALTVGRAIASPELADEYKYRRSNRQVFVGVLPSVLLGGVSVAVAFGGRHSWVYPASAAVTGAVVAALWSAARYQERVAQSLIIDSAFLNQWRVLPVQQRAVETRD
jgi:hypothetical protein